MRVRACVGFASALGCAALLAACGGSATNPKKSAGSPYGPKSSPAAMSRCMRANGLSNFPDPRSGPGGGGVGFPGGFLVMGRDALSVMGQSFSGPAVVHAEQACKEYMPPSGPGPTISASEKRAMLADAQCMRTHGVPNFPDPDFTGGAVRAGSGGVDPNSPAFKRAAAACGAGRGGDFGISVAAG